MPRNNNPSASVLCQLCRICISLFINGDLCIEQSIVNKKETTYNIDVKFKKAG